MSKVPPYINTALSSSDAFSVLSAPSKKITKYADTILATTKNINVSRYAEDLTWAYHSSDNTMTKSNETITVLIDDKEIVLQRMTSSNFYGTLASKYSNAGLTPFKVGEMYMLSMYVYSERDQWFMMRFLPADNSAAHDYKLAKAKKATRVWCVGKATTTSLIDFGASSSVAYGSATGVSPTLIFQGSMQSFDAYVGGVQIEAISNASYKDGIAIIGDSTFAINSGGAATDAGRDFGVLANREVTHTLAALLNCCVFNRAVSGERLDQMNARWATDITPLAARSKYVIIQGGLNDIGQGRTLAQMQASVQSMIEKSIIDGFTDYAIANVTPNYNWNDANKEALRLQYNEWLLATYPTKCRDIASVVADPKDPSKLRAEYYNDGIHYIGAAKFAVASYLASVNTFTLSSPTEYFPSDMPFLLADWIRESTTAVAAGATISGSSRRVIASGITSGSAKLAPTKFSVMGGSDLAGIVAIQASSDGGTTWYPVAQTAMAQVNGAGNFGGYVESPIVESVMRGILTNTAGSTQTRVVLSTRVS